MTRFISVETFEEWRTAARNLIVAETAPVDVCWSTRGAQLSLFDTTLNEAQTTEDGYQKKQTIAFRVPPDFLELARQVACHMSVKRWDLLYRTLWRLTHGEKYLLEITTDDEVHELSQMRKAVSRDVHKMKAFVRFRKVVDDLGAENFIAWHRPDHRIVRLAAPFFARRFKSMNWAILTPHESVTWDQSQLHFGPGVPVTEAPESDVLEDLWRTYYASIFNPARIKIAMMKREMPVRHWATLPETKLIDQLLREAPARVQVMIDSTIGFADTATAFMPAEKDLNSLRLAAACCKACDLHTIATQTVFGEGAVSSRIVIVGEQPGDREDVAGIPFVGPAGELLNDALLQAGIDRSEVYITNVVKHFNFVERGKQRLHKKPSSRHIYACRPWLEAELNAIRPQVLVCLGATPAQALFGRDFKITQSRGVVQASEWCERTVATWHPAAILRMPDLARREQMHKQLVSDLRTICQLGFDRRKE